VEVPSTMDALAWLRKHLDDADPDLLRSMVKAFADQLMSAEASALCNAGYGEVTASRVNSRNGYRSRDFDTRAGTIELVIPKPSDWQRLSRLAGRVPPPRRAGARRRRSPVLRGPHQGRTWRRRRRPALPGDGTRIFDTKNEGNPVDRSAGFVHPILAGVGLPAALAFG